MAIRGIRHFVQYVDKILMAQHIAIILEIADGTLEASIDAKQKVDAELAKRMVSQMIAAIIYLHQEVKFYHLDLKQQNILTDRNNNAIICDFGLAHRIPLTGYLNYAYQISCFGSKGYRVSLLINNSISLFYQKKFTPFFY